MKIVGILFAVVAGVFILLLVIGSGPPSEESRARYAIAQCWGNQGKPSLDPSEARFVAGACEMMERDFTERYHRKP